MGRLEDRQSSLFYDFCLEDRIPSNHPLRSLDAVLDFDKTRAALARYYSHTGRPSIDPELMLRMLLIGYAYGIRSERRLVEEVSLNLAYRWFCRLGLEGDVPDHSTFSKNRYGRFRESDVYRALFEDVVQQCRKAGLVPGEGFAVDGSFICADASREQREATVEAIREGDKSARPVREYLAALDAGNPAHAGDAKYLSPTDPAAAWNTKEGPGRFAYFDNYMIDTAHGIIVDVEATPARTAQEVVAAKAMLERVTETHGITPDTIAADKCYGTGPFLAWLKDHNVVPHIPVLDRQSQTKGIFTREAFAFDAERNVFICPQGKILKHRNAQHAIRIHTYRASEGDCRDCPIKGQCTFGLKRTLSVPFDEAVRQEVMALQNTEAYQRSRQLRKKVEMLFAHLKRIIGLRRLRLRGPTGAQDEFLLAATAQNLRKLAKLIVPTTPHRLAAA